MSWTIDNAHSQITFSVRHMMISNARGRFENFSGVVDFNENDPTASTVSVKIEAASINTREEKRDGHLRSPDFFNAEAFPYLTFKSNRVEKLDQNHGRLYGNLTIRDITHPVVLDVEYSGQSRMWASTSAGFSALTTINRKDWGLVWNQTLESGGLLVGENVTINIELEIKKVEENQEASQTA